MKSVLS